MESNKPEKDCGICLNIMVEPSLTPCNHILCYDCLESALYYRKTCPYCRAEFKEGFKPKIDQDLAEKIKELDPKAFENRVKELQIQRESEEKIEKLIIIYGNTHEVIESDTRNNHRWTAYVRLENKKLSISKYIESVLFELHPTFWLPERLIKEPPFEVKCKGWGTFMIPITINWKKNLKKEPTKLSHVLSFAEGGKHQTDVVILNPESKNH